MVCMKMKDIFDLFLRAFGTHTNAARWLGFGRQHYRALRNGKYPLTPKNEAYIRFKAAELEAMFAANGGKLPAHGKEAAHGD